MLSHRVYHNSNLKLLESTQRGALSLILRSFKSTPTIVLYYTSLTNIRQGEKQDTRVHYQVMNNLIELKFI